MYYYPQSTQVPNYLLDVLQKQLKEGELKVFLTIIRKTIGQVDLNDKKRRIERAWISQNCLCSVLVLKTRRSLIQ